MSGQDITILVQLVALVAGVLVLGGWIYYRGVLLDAARIKQRLAEAEIEQLQHTAALDSERDRLGGLTDEQILDEFLDRSDLDDGSS